MVKFDLSEISEKSELKPLFSSLDELADKLSITISEYVANTRNLTTGITQSEGVPIASLPDVDNTKNKINDIQLSLQTSSIASLEEMYIKNALQLLIATGYVPLGWLFHETKHPDLYSERFIESWGRILSDFKLCDKKYGPLYPHISSFGIMVRSIGGSKNSDLSFFVIYNNQTDRLFLERYIKEYNIYNIVIMSESEYSENLVNKVLFRFLVKFDKISNQYSGTVFKAYIDLVKSVPSYGLKIGCSKGSMFHREEHIPGDDPRLQFINFKKGESVSTVLFVPTNHIITSISVNGTTYFVENHEFTATGITIVRTNINSVNGYNTYNITLPNLMENTVVYVNSCEDLTSKTDMKLIDEINSEISATNAQATIKVTFNRPFIYIDPSKIHIYAKEMEDSVEVEITSFTFLYDDQMLVERIERFDRKRPPHHHHHRPHYEHLHLDDDNNVHVNHDHVPSDVYGNTFGCYTDTFNWAEKDNIPDKPTDGRDYSIIRYMVNNCQTILLSFEGFSHYKYFRVVFEDYCLVASINVPGSSRIIDIIPHVEEYSVLNKSNEEVDDEVNTDGDSDNNTVPDVVISPGLGLSYDRL